MDNLTRRQGPVTAKLLVLRALSGGRQSEAVCLGVANSRVALAEENRAEEAIMRLSAQLPSALARAPPGAARSPAPPLHPCGAFGVHRSTLSPRRSR